MVTIGSDLAGIQTWITSDEPSRPAEEKAEWRTEKTSTNGGPETTSSNRAGVHPLPSSKFPLRKADPLKSRAIRRPQVCGDADLHSAREGCAVRGARAPFKNALAARPLLAQVALLTRSVSQHRSHRAAAALPLVLSREPL